LYKEQLIYKEQTIYNIRKRLERKVKRKLGLWRRNNYDVRVLSRDGKPKCKKVIFQQPERASLAYSNLRAFGPSAHFPEPIRLNNSEVMVNFISGAPLGVIDGRILSKLADFYVTVYKREPRLQSLEKTNLWGQFEGNMSCLLKLRVVDEGLLDKLYAMALDLAPADIWMGFDYTDPIKNNLVLTESNEMICAVDIKNLHSGSMLGRGMAKARRRWLTDDVQASFFNRLEEEGVPDFQSYFPFIQLFDTAWRIAHKLTQEERLTGSRKLRFLRKNKLALPDFMERNSMPAI
jgi:hypothetical protein